MTMERRHGGSSTATMPPLELEMNHIEPNTPSNASKRAPSVGGRSLGSNKASSNKSEADADRNETLPSPTTATEFVEKWNSPRINLYRLPATFWSFVVMGMNDATYGAIIPYLEKYYGLSYIVVSLIFLSPFVGYNIAAVMNNTIHMKLGQRGVAYLGPVCHIIAYVVISQHPPYPVLVVVFILAGLGNGLEDAAWNAWIGAMAHANEIMGFLHGCYGLGATIAPLIATTMITKADLPWFYWYYVMVSSAPAAPALPMLTSTQIAVAAIELGTSLHSFWGATGAVFREAHPRTSSAEGSRLKEATFKMPAARITWLSAFFLLGYVGIEVALGGWIVTFMIQVRHGAAFASGMTATGFWLGITVGRLILGFVTPKIGEKLAIAVCYRSAHCVSSHR